MPKTSETENLLSAHRKVKLLRFTAIFGWLGFILALLFFNRSNKVHQSTIGNLEAEAMVSAQEAKVFSEEANVSAAEIQSLKQVKERLESNGQALQQKLTTQASEASTFQQQSNATVTKKNGSILRLENKLKQTEAGQEELHLTLVSLLAKELLSAGATSEEIDRFVKALHGQPLTNPTQVQLYHNQIAKSYLHAGNHDSANKHLALAGDTDSPKTQKLIADIQLSKAIANVNKAIKDKLSDAETKKSFQHAWEVLETRKTSDPTSYAETSNNLFELQLTHILSSPPLEAIKKFESLLGTLKTEQKLSGRNAKKILAVTLRAYLISYALGNKEQCKHYETLITNTKADIPKLKDGSTDPQIFTVEATLSLSKLDELFITGEPSAILKQVSHLQQITKHKNFPTSVIFDSAAAGHQAAVYFERGEITKGRKFLTDGISNLQAFVKKHPQHATAQFRLGVLYWLQAQLTTSSSVVSTSLQEAKVTLEKALQLKTGVLTNTIEQFSAMVDGDLGHFAYKNNRKSDAKRFFSSALAHWKKIEQKWGKTSETKEGIDYCTWRISSL